MLYISCQVLFLGKKINLKEKERKKITEGHITSMYFSSYIAILSTFCSEEDITNCYSKQSDKQKSFLIDTANETFLSSNIWQDVFHLNRVFFRLLVMCTPS